MCTERNSADDHTVHQLGVMLAGRSKAGAKHLQKALDRRHRLALSQCAKAKGAAAIAAFWDDAVQRGDIPEAYWAVLTHPATTEDIVKRVFGELHMLSHLVGAANRADIRRLRQLERDNAALAATIERQQQRLRDGFTSRDATIRRLTDALARKASDNLTAAVTSDDARALAQTLADRERRLANEVMGRESLVKRLESVSAELAKANRARQRAEQELETYRSELAAAESRIDKLLPIGKEGAAETLYLNGLCVLYVGGRAHQMPRLKALVEETNGRFLHHDGGVENNAALIPGLVSRADVAVFPVDCISHDAATTLKRTCRQMGKRYLALRTSSLTSLLAGLATLRAGNGSPGNMPL